MDRRAVHDNDEAPGGSMRNLHILRPHAAGSTAPEGEGAIDGHPNLAPPGATANAGGNEMKAPDKEDLLAMKAWAAAAAWATT